MTPSLLDGALPLVDADKATEHFLKMMTEVSFEKVCQKFHHSSMTQRLKT